MKIPTGQNILDSMLKDITSINPDWGIPLRVGCVKMAAPRHERFDFMRDLGFGHIDAVFNHTPLNATNLAFIFPERHMSVHEQQGFIYALKSHPQFSKLESVDMLTSSPLIISNIHSGCLRVLTWQDDDLHNGKV